MIHDESHQTELDIINSVLNGHTDNFEKLIVKYEDKLSKYIKRISNSSKEDVEDILQEVFIKVFLRLNDYDSRMSFSSWIYRITHNVTISRYRYDKSRLHGQSVEIPEEKLINIASDTFSQEDILAITECTDRLKNEIENLKIKYREVIVLRYFEDKNYSEISDILKIPKGTVSTLLKRSKEILKKALNCNI